MTGLPEDYPARLPNGEERLDIAARIWELAETLLDDPDRSRRISDEWIGAQPDRIADLHMRYLAGVGPALAAGIVGRHLALADGELWGMQALPGADTDPARDTVMRAFVRHLNADHTTAIEIVNGAVEAGGVQALCDIAGEALLLLAYTIRSERDGVWAKVARTHAAPPPARHPKRRRRGGRRGRG